MAEPSADHLQSLFGDSLEMLRLTWTAFRRQDVDGLEKADALGRDIHRREKELTARLVASPQAEPGLRFLPAHLERIGDAVEGLVRCLRAMAGEETRFTEGGVREVEDLFGRAVALLECCRDLAATGNAVLARHVEIESMRFQEVASSFAQAHERRLLDGVCSPAASSAYLAILDYLREVVRHTRQAAGRVTVRTVAPEPSPDRVAVPGRPGG